MGLKHLLSYLVAPAAFTLAFLLGGTPNAPIASVLPTVGGCAFATGPGYTGSAGGVSSPPCNYYDAGSDGYSWIGGWFDTYGTDTGCVNCGALAEHAETHTAAAIAMGVAALATGWVPTISILAGMGSSLNAAKAWYYARVRRLAGC